MVDTKKGTHFTYSPNADGTFRPARGDGVAWKQVFRILSFRKDILARGEILVTNFRKVDRFSSGSDGEIEYFGDDGEIIISVQPC